MNTNHPWQSGPTELIKYAIEHLHREGEFNQRIAFLLLDVGVETLFKTFLQLPEAVTGTKVSFSERVKASEGNFHELTLGIKKEAENRLDNIDLTHVQFYHDLRNKLYHQGNGITVPADKVEGYAAIAVKCLKSLLDVDLYPFLYSKQEEEQRRVKEQAKFEEFENTRQEIKAQLEDLHQTAILALENVEPALVMPSFRKQYEKWVELFEAQHHAWNSRLWIEHKVDKTADEVKYQPKQYASLLAETKPTMPKALNDFVDNYNLKGDDVLPMAFLDDFEEVLLNMSIIALKLPIDPHFVYFNAGLIVRQKTTNFNNIMPFLGENTDDPISELMKLSEKVSKEIKEIKDALLSSTQAL